MGIDKTPAGKILRCDYTGQQIDAKVGYPRVTAAGPAFTGCFRDWNCVLAHAYNKVRENNMKMGRFTTIRDQIYQICGGAIDLAPAQEDLKVKGIDWFNQQYQANNTGAQTLAQEEERRKVLKEQQGDTRKPRKTLIYKNDDNKTKFGDMRVDEFFIRRGYAESDQFAAQFLQGGQKLGIVKIDPTSNQPDMKEAFILTLV